jgi:hypothetical protein
MKYRMLFSVVSVALFSSLGGCTHGQQYDGITLLPNGGVLATVSSWNNDPTGLDAKTQTTMYFPPGTTSKEVCECRGQPADNYSVRRQVITRKGCSERESVREEPPARPCNHLPPAPRREEEERQEMTPDDDSSFSDFGPEERQTQPQPPPEHVIMRPVRYVQQQQEEVVFVSSNIVGGPGVVKVIGAGAAGDVALGGLGIVAAGRIRPSNINTSASGSGGINEAVSGSTSGSVANSTSNLSQGSTRRRMTPYRRN